MPKTASKRAQARKATRVQRAHAEKQPTVVRRVPAAQRRRNRPTGIRGFFQRYPVASGLFVILVLGVAVMVAHAQQLGPWAPPPPKVASCNLKTHHCNMAPPMTINPNKTYTATIKTAKGDVVIALDAKDSPIAVNNFVFLANQHYYDGTYFWRVETPGQTSQIDPSGGPSPLSLVQGGSVSKDGNDPSSQPGYTIKDEKVVGDYTPGTVAMAKTQAPNSASSQFFIDIGDESQYFSKTYQIFGHVTSGMDVVQQIKPGDKIEGVTITAK